MISALKAVRTGTTVSGVPLCGNVGAVRTIETLSPLAVVRWSYKFLSPK